LVGLRQDTHDDVSIREDSDWLGYVVRPVFDDDEATDVKFSHAPRSVEKSLVTSAVTGSELMYSPTVGMVNSSTTERSTLRAALSRTTRPQTRNLFVLVPLPRKTCQRSVSLHWAADLAVLARALLGDTVMMTKARSFKQEQLRSRPKRKADVARATKARGAMGRMPSDPVHTAERHPSRSAGRKALVVLEDSLITPSRKSTRKGKNRGRPSEGLERREQNRKRSPEARARASIAKSLRVRGSSH
jgi:hypothetical protein